MGWPEVYLALDRLSETRHLIAPRAHWKIGAPLSPCASQLPAPTSSLTIAQYLESIRDVQQDDYFFTAKGTTRRSAWMSRVFYSSPSLSHLILSFAMHDMTDPPCFLDLPAEIRNHIYEELLLSPIIPTDLPQKRKLILAKQWRPSKTIPYPSGDHDDNDLLKVPLVHPAILGTCRRINQEATPILYSYNTFTAHATLLTSHPSLVHDSRLLLYPDISKLRNIRRWHIAIRLDCDARTTAEKLKQAFDSMEEVSVMASESMFRASGLDNLLLFADIRGVGKASVLGSVEKVVAEWLERMMMGKEGSVAPSLDEWRLTAMARDGGLKSERDGTIYNMWTHGNR